MYLVTSTAKVKLHRVILLRNTETVHEGAADVHQATGEPRPPFNLRQVELFIVLLHDWDVYKWNTGGQSQKDEPDSSEHPPLILVQLWQHEHEECRDTGERDDA